MALVGRGSERPTPGQLPKREEGFALRAVWMVRWRTFRCRVGQLPRGLPSLLAAIAPRFISHWLVSARALLPGSVAFTICDDPSPAPRAGHVRRATRWPQLRVCARRESRPTIDSWATPRPRSARPCSLSRWTETRVLAHSKGISLWPGRSAACSRCFGRLQISARSRRAHEATEQRGGLGSSVLAQCLHASSYGSAAFPPCGIPSPAPAADPAAASAERLRAAHQRACC